MENCVFCKIVDKELPSWIVHEDENVICFLPLEMEAYGHTLVAPKAHHVDLFSVSAPALSFVMAATQKVAVHYREAIGATGVNLLHASGIAAQQSVPHFHIHLIPRFDNDGLDAWPTLAQAQHSKEELLQKLHF